MRQKKEKTPAKKVLQFGESRMEKFQDVMVNQE